MGGRVVPNEITKKFFCLIIFLLGNFLYAQTTIKGVVKDTQNVQIPSISVLATKRHSDTIVTYTYTDTQGNFSLQISEFGFYELLFDGLAYAKKVVEVEIKEKGNIILDNIILEEEETQLNEVIVQAVRPITVKKDTIIFDAAAFSRGNEMVVEDLLKNIPGLAVDANGRITVEGKEVEKVMVDNDDFFDKGYTILTKNMPSHAVDKVEVLQHYSNNRLLKGIEDSERVALNLTLKEDNKNVWFGDLSLGHDITGNNQYEANANMMSFGDANKFYFLTSLNNTGVDVSGDISFVVRPNRFAEPGTLGNDQSAASLLNLTGYGIGLKKERLNFNNVELLSINSISKLSSKTKLKVLGLLKTDNNKFFRSGFESYLLDARTFTNYENYKLRKNSLTGFGQIDFTYDISSKEMIEFIGKYNNSREDSNSALEFNQESTTELLKERNELIDQKVVYSNKFKEDKVLVFTGRFIEERLPQDYTVNQFFFEDLFSETGEIRSVSQISESKMKFTGLEGHLLNKKDNGDLLEVKVGYTFRKDNLFSQLFLEEEGGAVAPVDFNNNSIYQTNDFYATSKYIRKISNLSLIGNLNLHQYHNKLLLDGLRTNIEKPFFLNPGVRMEWDINKRNTFYSSFSYNVTNAGILDLYDGFLLTSYRNFSKGTGELEQTDASNFNVGYRLGNWNDLFFAGTSFSYTRRHEYFSNNIDIQPDYTLTSKVLIEDQEMMMGNINLERYLQKLSTNFKVNLSGSKSEYENVVNGQSRSINFLNLNYGFEFRSGFEGIFNFNFGSTWKYNKLISRIETSYTDNVTFANFNFLINSNLDFEIESERYFYGNLDETMNDYYFLDFGARYKLEKKNLSFAIQGKNLFNTNTFRSYSVSDISISSTEYRLLPRFVMLKATYRF